jgi:hypothetical protein
VREERREVVSGGEGGGSGRDGNQLTRYRCIAYGTEERCVREDGRLLIAWLGIFSEQAIKWIKVREVKYCKSRW